MLRGLTWEAMAEGDSGLSSEGGGVTREVQHSPLYRKMTIVTHSVIFLYATAFWIQVGAMPFLSKKLGADPVVFGYLETVFAVSMLLGGPIFGRFGDLFGARAALMVAFLSSFLTYAVLAVADSIFMLFISRLCAFMMHAMHGSQMVMTDVSGFKERADALGKLGVSYGVGMVIGPTLGGYVTTLYSEQHSATVAAALCLVAMVIIMLTVPTTTKDPVKIAAADSKENKQYESGSVFNLRAIMALLAIPMVLYVLVLKTVVGVPAGIFHSMFTIINIERFQLTPETNGRLLSYVGILTMIMQGFGVGFLSKRFPDNLLIQFSIITTSLSYLVLSLADSLWFLAVVLVPMVMAGSILSTIASSAITKSVPETATGTALGLNMAIHSLIRTVAPTVGGYMYTWFGFASFGLLGFAMNGALAIATMLPRRVTRAMLSWIPGRRVSRTTTHT